MPRRPIQTASPSETAFFANADDARHPEAAQTLARWNELTKSDVYFYMPVEKDPDDPKGIGHIYMEAPRESEPWLGGVIVAFRSQTELTHYVSVVCGRRDSDESLFTHWRANLQTICTSMPSISKSWDQAKNGGIRVELCKVTQGGTIEYVDTLWDNTTT